MVAPNIKRKRVAALKKQQEANMQAAEAAEAEKAAILAEEKKKVTPKVEPAVAAVPTVEETPRLVEEVE